MEDPKTMTLLLEYFTESRGSLPDMEKNYGKYFGLFWAGRAGLEGRKSGSVWYEESPNFPGLRCEAFEKRRQ